MEDDFDGRQPFDERRPSMEDVLPWKETIDGRRPSMEDDHQRVFKECLNEVLFCNCVVACQPLQQPKQKESLFQPEQSFKNKELIPLDGLSTLFA